MMIRFLTDQVSQSSCRSCFAATILAGVILWALPAVAASPPSFAHKWGNLGSGNREFDTPVSIAVDSAGNIYVVDRDNHRIQKFTPDGIYVTQWGTLGTGDGEFDTPNGLAINSSDQVYVTDTFNNRVQRFLSNGTFFGAWGFTGTGNGQFLSPRAIAIDNADQVYVTEDGFASKRVQKFTSGGAYLTQWGSIGSGDGQFISPRGIAVDDSSFVYVTDTLNDRIQKFTDTGTFVMKWGVEGGADGELSLPIGLAWCNGLLLVADSDNHRFQTFNSQGIFQFKFGTHCELGSGMGCVDPDGAGPRDLGDGQFHLPQGVAAAPNGDILVTDTGNHRVQKFVDASVVGIFDPDPTFPITQLSSFPNPTRRSSRIALRLAETASGETREYQVDIQVLDPAGRLVRRVFSGTLPSGDHLLSWDGTSDTGQPVTPSIYFIRAVVDGARVRTTKVVRLH